MSRQQFPKEVHGVQEILDDGVEVHEMSLRDLLTEILLELRKANVHNQIITDEEINEGDI